MKLYVKTDERCVNSYREGGDYGEWSASNSFEVEGVYLTKTPGEGYDMIEVAFDAKVGDTAAVLHMTYSSGDSFGSSTGNGEVIWVFPDGNTAVQAMRKIEANIENFSIEFDDGFGNLIKMHNPAAGYFERLENIDVKVCVIKES